MSDDLPPPLLPPDVDLRDFRWIKLDVTALINSDFNQTHDDTAWRCGVTLWFRAWHQVPAGSVPNDEAMLCSLAGLGRDLKRWRAVQTVAMHGFVLCSDNRFYHRFLCATALSAHTERQAYRMRKLKDRERKSSGSGEEFQRNSSGSDDEIQAEGVRNFGNSAVEGEGEGESKKENTPSLRSVVQKKAQQGSRWPSDAIVPDDWKQEALEKRGDHQLATLDVNLEAEKFANYWSGKSGKDATKVDWHKTWINWALKAEAPRNGHGRPTAHDNFALGALLAAEDHDT
jgi:hypothetical protein